VAVAEVKEGGAESAFFPTAPIVANLRGATPAQVKEAIRQEPLVDIAAEESRD